MATSAVVDVLRVQRPHNTGATAEASLLLTAPPRRPRRAGAAGTRKSSTAARWRAACVRRVRSQAERARKSVKTPAGAGAPPHVRGHPRSATRARVGAPAGVRRRSGACALRPSGGRARASGGSRSRCAPQARAPQAQQLPQARPLHHRSLRRQRGCRGRSGERHQPPQQLRAAGACSAGASHGGRQRCIRPAQLAAKATDARTLRAQTVRSRPRPRHVRRRGQAAAPVPSRGTHRRQVTCACTSFSLAASRGH